MINSVTIGWVLFRPPLVNAKTMTLEAREDGRYPAQGGHPAP
jgi:hypothetical protein